MAIYPLFYCLVRFSTTKNYISWNVQGCFIIQLSMFANATSQERCLHQFMTTARECEKLFHIFLFLSKQLVYYIFSTSFCQDFFSKSFLKLFRFFSLFFATCYILTQCFFLVNNFFHFIFNKAKTEKEGFEPSRRY